MDNKKKKSIRPVYPAVDLSGLDEASQKTILKAMSEEEKKQTSQASKGGKR